MDTLTPASICRHARFRLATSRPTQFIDLTARLQRLVTETGLACGVLNVQTQHTTTGIVINEHEPLLLGDFETLLETLVPEGSYAHDDVTRRAVNVTAEERVNGHAHGRALFLPSAVSVNVVDGLLWLGRWQRIFFVELDGPRDRDVSTVLMGEAAR